MLDFSGWFILRHELLVFVMFYIRMRFANHQPYYSEIRKSMERWIPIINTSISFITVKSQVRAFCIIKYNNIRDATSISKHFLLISVVLHKYPWLWWSLCRRCAQTRVLHNYIGRTTRSTPISITTNKAIEARSIDTGPKLDSCRIFDDTLLSY